MGLSSRLCDVSADAVPVLMVAAAAVWVSRLRSFLHRSFHFFGFHQLCQQDDQAGAAAAAVGARLAGLVVLAEQLIHGHRAFPYGREEEEQEAAGCVVCLDRVREGERVRRLACCGQVFHGECLDGWFDQNRLSCPLCRSPLVPEDRAADAERHISAELVAWLAPY